MVRVLYPGSFDPVHNGHVEVVETLSRLFNEVIVAAMRNPQKGEPLFSFEDRREMLRIARMLPPDVVAEIIADPHDPTRTYLEVTGVARPVELDSGFRIIRPDGERAVG